MKRAKEPLEDFEFIETEQWKQARRDDNNRVRSRVDNGFWSHSSFIGDGSKTNPIVIDSPEAIEPTSSSIRSTGLSTATREIGSNGGTVVKNDHNNNSASDNVDWWRQTFKAPSKDALINAPYTSHSGRASSNNNDHFYKPGLVTVPSVPVRPILNPSVQMNEHHRNPIPQVAIRHVNSRYDEESYRHNDSYQPRGYPKKPLSPSRLDDILDEEDARRREPWDPSNQLNSHLLADGGLMNDVTALDAGYEHITEKLREGPTVEASFKSKTPAFDIRRAMMADTGSTKPSTAPPSTSSSSLSSAAYLALAVLESSRQHSSSAPKNQLSESMQDVNIDSLFLRLLSRSLGALLSYEDVDDEISHKQSGNKSITAESLKDNNFNEDQVTSSSASSTYNAIPVLSSPRTRFLNEMQYVQYFEDRQLLEILAAAASHLRSLRITVDGSASRRGAGPAGKSHRHGGVAYAEAQVYETAYLVTQCLQVSEYSHSSGIQTSNGSSKSASPPLQEVQFANLATNSSIYGPSTGKRDQVSDGSILKDDLVLIIRHHKVDPDGKDLKGRDMRSLTSLSSHRHLLGIVTAVSHASDSSGVAATSNRSDRGASTTGVAISDGLGDFRYRIVVFDHFADPDAPSDSTRLCMRLRDGAEYSLLPLMALTTFTREWTALQCVRLQNLMLLTPYILKAAHVVSATRLEEVNSNLEMKMRLLEMLLPQSGTSAAVARNSSILPHLDPRQTRVDDAFDGLKQLLHQLESIQIDGSVLKKTGIVQTLTKLKRDEKFNRCRDSAAALIKKWKEQVVTDNQYSTLKSMQGGNIVAVPDASSSVACPSSVPSRLWRRLCESYNNSQLFAIKYVCDRLDDAQDTRVALIQGPPGTGKTSTILAMVASLLHKKNQPTSSNSMRAAEPLLTQGSTGSDAQSPLAGSQPVWSHRNRLLICAPSNSAVDELLLRLTKGVLGPDGETTHVKVVRMGEPLDGCAHGIRELSLEYQAEEIVKQSALWASYNRCAASIQALYGRIDTLSAKKTQLNVTQVGAEESKIRKDQVRSRYGEIERMTVPETEKERTLRQLRDARFDLRQLRKERDEIFTELDRLRAEVRRDLIYEAQVVVATLSGSGKQIFIDHIIRDELRFETIIVDEAAQATEPSTLIPLRYGCRRLVLVGDPRQLPATVLSPAAQRAGLGVSLFERLESAGHPVVLLFVQYRMHPDIRLFPSQHFYQGRLVDHPSVLRIANHSSTEISHHDQGQRMATTSAALSALSQRIVTCGALRQPVAFFDVPSREISVGTSFRNDDEADFILAILQTLWHQFQISPSVSTTITSGETGDNTSHYNSINSNNPYHGEHLSELSIGIISSYKAQVKHIKAKLDETFSSSVDDPVMATRLFFHRRQIEINTVDGFQGKEKDIIILSCVRTSPHGIGFLADERRVNVAITRARHQLIVVGRAHALSEGSDTWRALISSLRNRQFVHKTNLV